MGKSSNVLTICALALIPAARAVAADDSNTPKAEAAIMMRINEIVIPKIDFKQVTLEDAALFLTEESAKVSRDCKGVKVTLRNDPPNIEVKIPLGLDEDVLNEIAKIKKRCWPDRINPPETRPVTLRLRNVPIIEAVKYITSLAGTTFQIQQDGIALGWRDERFEARVYKVPKSLLETPVKVAGAQQPATNSVEVVSVKDVREGFAEPGYIPRTISYLAGKQVVVVINTEENLKLFEDVLHSLLTEKQLKKSSGSTFHN